MADEGLTLNPNGTIDVTLDKPYKLRRPNFGEVRRLWEAWDTAAAIHDRLAQEAKEQNRNDDVTVRTERARAWLDFQRVAFGTLSEALPDDDDLIPPWLLTASVGGEFLAHWQSRPFPSG